MFSIGLISFPERCAYHFPLAAASSSNCNKLQLKFDPKYFHL